MSNSRKPVRRDLSQIIPSLGRKKGKQLQESAQARGAEVLPDQEADEDSRRKQLYDTSTTDNAQDTKFDIEWLENYLEISYTLREDVLVGETGLTEVEFGRMIDSRFRQLMDHASSVQAVDQNKNELYNQATEVEGVQRKIQAFVAKLNEMQAENIDDEIDSLLKEITGLMSILNEHKQIVDRLPGQNPDDVPFNALDEDELQAVMDKGKQVREDADATAESLQSPDSSVGTADFVNEALEEVRQREKAKRSGRVPTSGSVDDDSDDDDDPDASPTPSPPDS